MTQDQFDRESGFRLALAIFKGMLRKGILTASEFEKARQKLIARFNPPYGGMTDVLASALADSHTTAPVMAAS